MYKILLVDDEPMALEGLKYVIDWKSMNFSICGTCGNGKEAIQAIEKTKPDAVITDIKMPYIDGLELIKYTREHHNQDIKFIVVSGYGEFEYAKKAMQYDVRYYLQKPILQEDVEEVIQEVKKQLDNALKSRESEVDKKAVLEGILRNVFLENDDVKSGEYLKSFFDEAALMDTWNCSIIQLESSDQVVISDEFKAIKFKVRKAIDEIIKDDSGYFVLEQNLNTFIVLSPINKEKISDMNITSTAEMIYKSLTSIDLCSFTIGVGENVKGMKFIKHSYNTALIALEHRFYSGLNCLIFYDDIKNKTFNFEFNDFFMSSKILEAVQECDSDMVTNIIASTFNYFEDNRIAPDIVRMFTSNMICKIKNLIKEDSFINNFSIRKFKDHEITMQKLKRFFEEFCLEGSKYLKENRNANGNLERIEKFIKENYKRNITIREIAENVYMHPAYLGQLFIQKFGMNFNEYIHELRIEEAKRLMCGTNLKNNEIAESLGYCNYNSFLQQFQKCTGMKPTEFRNMKI